jgi:hypothetical protein
MAKKKQLAGKTTKLAKLPLTLALAEQSEEAGGTRPMAPKPLSGGEPLGAVYLHVIRELSALLAQLQGDSPDSLALRRPLLPPHIPKPQQLRQSLHLAQQGLRDLHLLLSQV